MDCCLKRKSSICSINYCCSNNCIPSRRQSRPPLRKNTFHHLVGTTWVLAAITMALKCRPRPQPLRLLLGDILWIFRWLRSFLLEIMAPLTTRRSSTVTRDRPLYRPVIHSLCPRPTRTLTRISCFHRLRRRVLQRPVLLLCIRVGLTLFRGGRKARGDYAIWKWINYEATRFQIFLT